MRAILVSVDYGDILEVTLPYNRHHFESVCIVTHERDYRSIQAAEENYCEVFTTNAFYEDEADFNKWKALEEGLDWFGRTGWITIMDADILWPKKIISEYFKGYFYSPYRRMFTDVTKSIPPEYEWGNLEYHPQKREFAGYTNIFHCDDPILTDPPWHQVDWKHAGGGDSFFQKKWPATHKIRTEWEVLHLGECRNWFGRCSQLTDGTLPEETEQRKQKFLEMNETRKRYQNFDREKIQ